MRTLAITQNITVDGAVEMLDDWFDPATQDPGVLDELRRQDEESDAFLVGRRTFEDLRGYWRHRDDDPTGIGAQLDGVAKYVVSSTLTDPAWERTTVLPAPSDSAVVEAVAALKDAPGRDIVVTGSITLCHTLLTSDLVDEVRLLVYPVVQGRGRRLFPGAGTTRRLRLVESRSFAGGVVLARYGRA